MNRRLTLIAACALLAMTPGCAGMPGFVAAPAPLAATTIDDTGLETAWRAFDLALDGINTLGDLGVIVPGSPKGKAVATGIRAVNRSLAAAERFAAAGSTADYATALAEAKAGIDQLRTALKGA